MLNLQFNHAMVILSASRFTPTSSRHVLNGRLRWPCCALADERTALIDRLECRWPGHG